MTYGGGDKEAPIFILSDGTHYNGLVPLQTAPVMPKMLKTVAKPKVSKVYE